MASTELNPQTCRVALLAGGKSGEREISIASGKNARAALEEAGFSVETIDPAHPDELRSLIDGSFDVAFICLHGRYGEDGAIQGFLEVLGIPYTGSNIGASAIAMNKAKAKDVYRLAGLPTPLSITVTRTDVRSLSTLIAEVIEKIGDHCVVKAAGEGSSLGLYIVEGAAELAEALERTLASYETVVVEKFVSGTELTVAVLGNDDPRALPVIQIVPANDFYDFDAKYTPGGSEHLCPAPIGDALTLRVQDLACRAHRALGCSGMSRTDFIVDGEGECWILETNTIPGMTGTSLLPDAARVAGMSFSDVCRLLVSLALERSAR